MTLKQDTITLIMRDEQLEKRFKKYRKLATLRGNYIEDLIENDSRFPGKQANLEIERLYSYFLTPNEIKKGLF